MRDYVIRSMSRSWVAILTAAVWTTSVSKVRSNDLQYMMSGHSLECFYDKLEEDEYLTMSLFIVEGYHLAADVLMEGPIADFKITGASDLNDAITKHERDPYGSMDFSNRSKKGKSIDSYSNTNSKGFFEYKTHVDFELMAMMENRYDGDVDDDYRSDDERSSYMENIQRKREMEEEMDTSRTSEEPWQKTVKVYAAGWYRVCVQTKDHEITAEIDMRKSSELGRPEDGKHVASFSSIYDHYEEPDVFEPVDAADEEDLEQARNAIKALHELLDETKEKQQHEEHRMLTHHATNAHSHYRMKLSSLVETALFLCVTGFQAHTIRKWFAGGPLLGR